MGGVQLADERAQRLPGLLGDGESLQRLVEIFSQGSLDAAEVLDIADAQNLLFFLEHLVVVKQRPDRLEDR